VKHKILSVAVLAAGVCAAHSAGMGTTSHSGHAGKVAGGHRDCTQLEDLWKDAGGSAGEAFTAAEIAMAESSGDQDATDDDGNGTVDRGYWQINSIHGAQSTYDAYGNARAAVLISDDGTNWGPWTTYKSGAYEGQCS